MIIDEGLTFLLRKMKQMRKISLQKDFSVATQNYMFSSLVHWTLVKF